MFCNRFSLWLPPSVVEGHATGKIFLSALQVDSHTHQLAVMLKTPQRCHEKLTKMSSHQQAKLCGAGLEAEVVNCGILAPGHSNAVSSP